MANGLAGHEHDFYRFVANSTWTGNTNVSWGEYSDLNEGFPYWFNGIVPLAYHLDDTRLKGQVADAVNAVLDLQASDGWLGPETGPARLFWARFPFCLGLIQLIEADSATYQDKVVTALHRYFELMNSMLLDNGAGFVYQGNVANEPSAGDFQWGQVRVQDQLISLQWLYENFPQNNSQLLLDNMGMLINSSITFADYWVPGVFIEEDLYNVYGTGDGGNMFPYFHGVNAGQGLKQLAVFRRYTHNDSMVDATQYGVNATFQYHGNSMGSVIGDEREDGLAPYQGAELCTAVETMYSMSYLYQALGQNYYADRAELAAFNALPTMLSPDWWARQYMVEENQPWALNMSEMIYWNDNTWSSSFGLEPDYPCCTVNHPQGFPKFVSALFTNAPNGLAHALLSPGTVGTTIGSNDVTINCDTMYPFNNVLSYDITTSSGFDFYVRVPSWADLSSSSISVSSESSDRYKRASTPLSPDPTSSLHRVSLPAGQSSITYTLETSIISEARPNDTVAIHYGALVYALEISYTNTSTPPKFYNPENEFYPDGYAPSQSRDYQLFNSSAWNIAIDPSTLEFHSSLANSSSGTTSLPDPIFAPGAPPTWITAQGCEIEWGLYRNSVPDVVPALADRTCQSTPATVTLRPIGGQKVHMVELPTISLNATQAS
ncbi:hypothetical protein EV356DRAFT_77285 [Viridothelium virens]|uniref:Uncharacterized protein n=1 Tax=Viridothelium virens TaxID=1048519 RepID=A0A6A6HEI0_VIRVR|nr:hypothetical protein EV356DRAFT_77285 [Viridothelium virens]